MTVSKPEHPSGSGKPKQLRQRDTPGEVKNSVLPFVAPAFTDTVGNPQEGNLATPINSSKLSRWFINQLPAYRQELSPFQRGLQIGLSHGFWLLGPFVALGPLRDTHLALLAGMVSAIGVVVIATLALTIYAASAPPLPIATLTTPTPPTDLNVFGWQAIARGFLVGGIAGVIFATVLLLLFSGIAHLILLSPLASHSR